MSKELPVPTAAIVAVSNACSFSAKGRKASSHSPYLIRHRNSLCFRIRIPIDIQACLGRKEYRRSLGPSYASTAKVKGLRLAAAALEVFAFTREALFARCGYGGYTQEHKQHEENGVSLDKNRADSVYTRLSGRTLDSLTDDDIRAVAAEWLLIALKGHDALKEGAVLGRRREMEEQGLSPEQVHLENQERTQSEGRICQKHAAIHKAALAQREFSHIQPEADRLLNLCGIHSSGQEGSHQYGKACEELTKAKITFYKMQDSYAEGNFDAYDKTLKRINGMKELPLSTSMPTDDVGINSNNDKGDETSIKFNDAVEEFFREKEIEGSWRPKVAGMERKKFELFKAVIDPDNTLSVGSIRAKHLVRYKEILHLMPANKGKKKEYRDLSIPQLLALVEAGNIPKELRMEANTIRTYCQSAVTFINWAARREYHSNPAIAGNLQIKAEKQAHEYRDPFTRDDITKLFSGLDLIEHQSKPARFWIPLLGLFTGARLEELAQLHLDDIVLVNSQEDARPMFIPGQPVDTATAEDETLCLFINKGKSFQRLKNAGSRRYVPLSPVLTYGLGFMNYLVSVFQQAEEARERRGGNSLHHNNNSSQGRLFPELTRRKETDNFAHAISKWFNVYRIKRGVIPLPGGGKKDFHSFRHTVARWCEQNDVPEKSAARFLGHTHDTMTFGRYGADTAARMLYQRITEGFGLYLKEILDIDQLSYNKYQRKT